MNDKAEANSRNVVTQQEIRNRFAGVFDKIYDLLSSVKLAIGLLIAILLCCLVGVTVYRDERAWEVIFGTIWFNGLLVLLVLNVAFCFFGRIRGRRVTMISLGMILFHLSFVAMFGGIIYNSFFYFRGMIRLAEGEALPSGQRSSYDAAQWGRFFNLSDIKGETALDRVHLSYKVGESDKRAAYEIRVGEVNSSKQGIIYITESLTHNGYSYFNDKEGYVILTILYDSKGNELYGAYVPLQSIKLEDETFLYTTGSKFAPGYFMFPGKPEKPLFNLQTIYHPSKLEPREGDITFKVWPLTENEADMPDNPSIVEKGALTKRLRMGEYFMEAREVRYWAGMNVSHEPGKPIVLTSLWVGLVGMIITFIGRIRKSSD